MSTPAIEPVAATAEHPSSFRRDYFGDLYLYKWNEFAWRVPAMCMAAIALCLGVGLGVGHPAAGMIAAGGAMTVGFGAMQSIDGSRFVPMIGASIGMALSTFIGMIVGHESYFLVLTCAIWGFGYGLLTTRAAGVSWVGQQCVVYLLVSSAFPFGLRAAAVRASLVLAGGGLQILLTSLQLRVLRGLRKDMYAFMHHSIVERNALRESMGQSFRQLLGQDAPPNPVFAFGIRLAVVLALSTEIYHRLHIASGYWIPMTAMLVLKPAFNETVKRAMARIAGTLAGAVLTSYLVAFLQPAPMTLAVLVVLFAFFSYCMLNVNYAVFSIFLTSYIVVLLALARLPGALIAHRRAACTIAGGLLALVVHLDAVRRWRRRAQRQSLAPAADPA